MPPYVMEGAGGKEEVLLVVYDADSGFLRELKNYVHKAVSPSTHRCVLCGLTYGSTGISPDWKKFLKGLDISVELLHRDEMAKKYPAAGIRLPAVFIKSGPSLNLVMGAGEIVLCKNLEELMDLLTYKLKHRNEMKTVQ
ncbi:hypothetical protein L1S32_10270 [Methanogenium sp. S4BF]|uniref:hypothetical protein n=1 Tax=Methanogenium sp. S4BF TaxID=1789226 RepID=UPI002416F369|nr:hypothetical protein [Methanogenium sp. S4BF]WFN34219.1 hypothetical protein L1S32_10270 [Methanogenium sp. S4BF]